MKKRAPAFQPEQLARRFPDKPGVYIMKDDAGKIIYVGKAKNLKKRVLSYFVGEKDIKTRTLVSQAVSVEPIITNSEYEALLLENTLIKKWQPRYNINLKDGKTYPVIKITNEPFPRIYKTRRIVEDGASYFGPFPNVRTLRVYLDLVERRFPLRKCRGPLRKRDAPCLYYHIGRCAAPCCGRISREEYAMRVDGIRELLSRKPDELIALYRARMEEESAALEFEKAARSRDILLALEEIAGAQSVVDFNPASRDYVALAVESIHAAFAVLSMRDGKIVDRALFASRLVDSPEEGLAAFLLQFYSKGNLPPQTVYVSHAVPGEELAAYFKKELGREVAIVAAETGEMAVRELEGHGPPCPNSTGEEGSEDAAPPIGHMEAASPEANYSAAGDARRHGHLLRMALENAREHLAFRIEKETQSRVLASAKKTLNLPKKPFCIEGFDIAHLEGKHTVASLVCFKNGKPDKSSYRTFHVKSLDGKIDDFASMREVVARRYSRLKNDGEPLPDLILIDGGKGQLNAAHGILRGLGLSELPIVSLAKKEEEIYTLGGDKPLKLAHTHSVLRLLVAVRDEAHRFATRFNKQLRAKDASRSILEDVPGIGPKRAKRILETCGSLDGVRAKSAEELAAVCKLPLPAAEAVLRKLKG